MDWLERVMKLTASWKSGGVSTSILSRSGILLRELRSCSIGSLLWLHSEKYGMCLSPGSSNGGNESSISLHNKDSSMSIRFGSSTPWDSPANHAGFRLSSSRCTEERGQSGTLEMNSASCSTQKHVWVSRYRMFCFLQAYHHKYKALNIFIYLWLLTLTRVHFGEYGHGWK